MTIAGRQNLPFYEQNLSRPTRVALYISFALHELHCFPSRLVRVAYFSALGAGDLFASSFDWSLELFPFYSFLLATIDHPNHY